MCVCTPSVSAEHNSLLQCNSREEQVLRVTATSALSRPPPSLPVVVVLLPPPPLQFFFLGLQVSGTYTVLCVCVCVHFQQPQFNRLWFKASSSQLGFCWVRTEPVKMHSSYDTRKQKYTVELLLLWFTFLFSLLCIKNDKRKCCWIYFGQIYKCCQSFFFFMSLLFLRFFFLFTTSHTSRRRCGLAVLMCSCPEDLLHTLKVCQLPGLYLLRENAKNAVCAYAYT